MRIYNNELQANCFKPHQDQTRVFYILYQMSKPSAAIEIKEIKVESKLVEILKVNLANQDESCIEF